MALLEVETATLAAKSRTSLAVVRLELLAWEMEQIWGLMHWPKGHWSDDMVV